MATLDRKRREKEERRKEILAAAEALFLEKGYESTVMDDIVERTELSKGTIYLYFTSKDELLYAVLVQGFKALNEACERAIAESPQEGFSQLDAQGKAYFKFATQNRAFMQLVKCAELTNPPQTLFASPYFQAFMTEQERSRNILMQTFIKGVQDGSISPEIDPRLATIYFGVVSKAIYEAMVTQEEVLKKGFQVEPEDFFHFAYNLLGNSVKNKK